MKNKITILLFCLFQTNFLYSQIESTILEKTDTVPTLESLRYAPDSLFFEIPLEISYYSIDSSGTRYIDSIFYRVRGGKFTEHYHYINGEQELKYTCYHNWNICISYTYQKVDGMEIISVLKFTDNDTVQYIDTILLYYPDSEALGYHGNNITLEAFNETKFSEMDTSENLMRIFILNYDEDSLLANVYIISNILRDSLYITKKTGECLGYFLKSKEELMKDYVYETTYKTIPSKKIKKTLRKMASLKYLPIEYSIDNLIVEYRINGKYYLLTSSYNLSLSIDDYPSEDRKVLKLVKKLITYLEDSFGANTASKSK